MTIPSIGETIVIFSFCRLRRLIAFSRFCRVSSFVNFSRAISSSACSTARWYFLRSISRTPPLLNRNCTSSSASLWVSRESSKGDWISRLRWARLNSFSAFSISRSISPVSRTIRTSPAVTVPPFSRLELMTRPPCSPFMNISFSASTLMVPGTALTAMPLSVSVTIAMGTDRENSRNPTTRRAATDIRNLNTVLAFISSY